MLIKAKKWDRLLILDYRLKAIIPFIKKKEDKLKLILQINEDVKINYENVLIVRYFFNKVGIVIINNQELETFYLKDKYLKIEDKVFKKIDNKVKTIKIPKNDLRSKDKYISKGFKIKNKDNNFMILERG